MSANLMLTRRHVLGGLVIAIALPGCKQSRNSSGKSSTLEPNAWLRIGSDDTITFFCDRAEMGQGVYTSLPMLVAEELGVGLERIKVEFAPPGDQYINNMIGGQITGGSTSVRDAWEKLRKAGATARHLLVTAAAEEWGINARSCKVVDGVIDLAAAQEAEVWRSGRGRRQTTHPEGRATQTRVAVHAHRQGAEAQGHAGQGRWQRDLRHRRETDGHGVRRAGATADARRLGEDFRRRESARHAGLHRHRAHLFRRRRGRRFLVACAQGARPAADRLGRRPQRGAQRREDRPDAAQGRARQPAAWRATTATLRLRSRARRAWFAPTTSCRCSHTPRSSRRTALPTCARTAPTSMCPHRFSRSRKLRRPRPRGSIPSR